MNKTQEDCRKEWEDLRNFVIARIKWIDESTPATPYTEPKWWLGMMEIQRGLYNLNEKKSTEVIG
jgi:hypothetical protein